MSKDEFKRAVLKWFPLVDKPRPDEATNPNVRASHPLHIIDLHADILRGLVWMCALFEDREIARMVGALGDQLLQKNPRHWAPVNSRGEMPAFTPWEPCPALMVLGNWRCCASK